MDNNHEPRCLLHVFLILALLFLLTVLGGCGKGDQPVDEEPRDELQRAIDDLVASRKKHAPALAAIEARRIREGRGGPGYGFAAGGGEAHLDAILRRESLNCYSNKVTRGHQPVEWGDELVASEWDDRWAKR